MQPRDPEPVCILVVGPLRRARACSAARSEPRERSDLGEEHRSRSATCAPRCSFLTAAPWMLPAAATPQAYRQQGPYRVWCRAIGVLCGCGTPCKVCAPHHCLLAPAAGIAHDHPDRPAQRFSATTPLLGHCRPAMCAAWALLLTPHRACAVLRPAQSTTGRRARLGLREPDFRPFRRKNGCSHRTAAAVPAVRCAASPPRWTIPLG